MERRRQAADAARAEVLVPGTQVCAWGEADTAQPLLRVGRIEAVEEQGLEVRLTHVEGAAAVAGPRTGSVISAAPGD